MFHHSNAPLFFWEYVFIVAPIPGEMIQFDEYIFSDGLKPPTSYLHIYHEFKPFMEVNLFNTWILWVPLVHPFLQGFVKNGEQVQKHVYLDVPGS